MRYLNFILFVFCFCGGMIYAQIPDLDGNVFYKAEALQLLEITKAQADTGANLTTEFQGQFVINQYAPRQGVVYADVNQNGNQEIIFGVANTLHALMIDGENASGFPVELALNEQIIWAPSLGDIDGDGALDIVFSVTITGGHGKLYALNLDGSLKSGFPVTDMGVFPLMPVLADVDLDGDDEIIASKRVSTTESYMYVFDHQGTPLDGWPFDMQNYPGSSAAVGDIDGDGEVEIVCESRDFLWVWNKEAEVREGFPYDIDSTDFALHSYAAPILADINQDGMHEIIFSSHKPTGTTYVLDAQGNLLDGWPQVTDSAWVYGSPIAYDVSGDGHLEIFVAEYGSFQSQPGAMIYGYDYQGNILEHFPMGPFWGSANQITLADVNDDGQIDLILDQNHLDSLGQGFMLAIDLQGNSIDQFCVKTQENTSFSQPSLVDLNNDGTVELIQQSNHLVLPEHYLEVFQTPLQSGDLMLFNPVCQLNMKHNGYYPPNNINSNFSEFVPSSAVVSPNPSSSKVHITYPQHIKQITLYNLQGQICIQKNVQSPDANLDLTVLHKGVYILEIKDFHGVIKRQSIVKN